MDGVTGEVMHETTVPPPPAAAAVVVVVLTLFEGHN